MFGKSEANRAKVFLEQDFEEISTILIGVEPPAPEEVRDLRKRLAELMSAVAPSEVQQFDITLQNMIKAYDPFGTGGRKMIYIRILKNEQSSVMATTFLVEDFSAEVEKFRNSGGKVRITTSRSDSISDPHGKITRLEAILDENRNPVIPHVD